MIRLISVLLFLVGTLVADTSIKLEKGWQFIGFPSNINDTSAFNNANVDIIWGYDAKTQAWLGFSPSLETSEKITSKGHKTLNDIQAWQGVWIHNKRDWSLTLKETTSPDANISLSQGWNLISLPTDMRTWTKCWHGQKMPSALCLTCRAICPPHNLREAIVSAWIMENLR